MTIDDGTLARMLGLPADAVVEREPLTGPADGVELAIVGAPGEAESRRAVVRRVAGEEAENHVAVLEALGRTGPSPSRACPRKCAGSASWCARPRLT